MILKTNQHNSIDTFVCKWCSKADLLKRLNYTDSCILDIRSSCLCMSLHYILMYLNVWMLNCYSSLNKVFDKNVSIYTYAGLTA